MSNHYHLLIETREANLVAGMRSFQTAYTVRFNRRHRLCGHLFQGRYKAVVVDPEERGYFVTLSDYIHLNPVRAGIVRLEDRLFDYRWSSYRWYAAKSGRPQWFTPEVVLGELGLNDEREGRHEYAKRMRERAVAELTEGREAGLKEIREGWCLGGVGFRERMLALLSGAGESVETREIDGSVRRDHGVAEAERVLKIGLKLFCLEAEDLGALPKGDPRKRAIAAAIRSRTVVAHQWIAAKLMLGHVSQVSRCHPDAPGIRELFAELLTQILSSSQITD